MLDRLIEFVSNHYALSSAFVLLLAALAVTESRRSGRNVTTRELTSLVNRDEAVVLDIRQQKDFATGHIVGAVHIPSDKLKARLNELEKHKDKTIVVVCQTGMSAGPSCAELKNAGFDSVRLAGGITRWREDSLPTVK